MHHDPPSLTFAITMCVALSMCASVGSPSIDHQERQAAPATLRRSEHDDQSRTNVRRRVARVGTEPLQ